MTTQVRSRDRTLVLGVLAGSFGGILFALAEMGLAAAGGLSPFDPLQVIGSLAFGSNDLLPASILAAAGLIIHFFLSATYGVVFVSALAVARGKHIEKPVFLVLGIVYAMLLWTFNFLVIAPILFPQITVASNFWLGFSFAHALYGLGLGGYLAMARGDSRVPV